MTAEEKKSVLDDRGMLRWEFTTDDTDFLIRDFGTDAGDGSATA